MARKKEYPGGFRLTLATAKRLAVQEFGTAKGLEKNRGTCLEGFFTMQMGILTLQAIAQRSGGYKDGGCDVWSEAAAFTDCNEAACRALEYLGEQTAMPNKVKSGSGAGT